VSLAEEERADDEGDQGDNNGVAQAGVDIAGRGADREPDHRQQAAEHAVADMVGQRHGGVADLRRERLDEVGGDRPVDQGHEDDLDEDEQHQQREVRVRGHGRGHERAAGVDGLGRERDRARHRISPQRQHCKSQLHKGCNGLAWRMMRQGVMPLAQLSKGVHIALWRDRGLIGFNWMLMGAVWFG
jgi:hypothetical protein